jgi:hypothetical protein
MGPRISSRLFYGMDEKKFHTAVQTALDTERKQKFKVASNIRRGKTVVVVLCVNAAGCHRFHLSLLSNGKNKDLDLELAFPLVLILLQRRMVTNRYKNFLSD